MTIPGIISALWWLLCTMSSSSSLINVRNSTLIIGNLIQFWFGDSASEASRTRCSVLSLIMLMIIGMSLLAEKVLIKRLKKLYKGKWVFGNARLSTLSATDRALIKKRFNEKNGALAKCHLCLCYIDVMRL